MEQVHSLGENKHDHHTNKRTQSNSNHVLRPCIRPKRLRGGKKHPNAKMENEHENHAVNNEMRNMQQSSVQKEIVVHEEREHITAKNND